MANLTVSDRPQNQNSKRTLHRLNPRMDFTPMVDLGFLLITFFMLTTSLSKPQIMPIVMPESDGVTEPTKQSKALTLLLGADNKVYWYEGLDMAQMDSTSFNREGLRQVILSKMEKVAALHGLQEYTDAKTGQPRQGSQLNVLIKPGANSTYKNLVDALDEMNICRVRYYCILDPTAEETALINH